MEYPDGVPHALAFGDGEILSAGTYDVSEPPSIARILKMDGGGTAAGAVSLGGD